MIKDIPQIGLGTWKIRGQKKIDQAIKSALESGYTHIDTARVYLNEKQIGKSLKKFKVDKNKLFITSKIFSFDYSGNRPTKSINKSLKALQINKIDLMLLHTPFVKNKELILNAYKKMIDARKNKKVRHIGVSNFSVNDLKLIKKATGEYPYINQIVASPTIRRIKVEKFCKNNNIKLTAYSTLRPYFNPTYLYPGSGMTPEQKSQVKAIGVKYNKNPGQILSRWAIQNGYNIIPKSINPYRIKTNIMVNDFALNQREMALLDIFNTLKNDQTIVSKFSKELNSFRMKIIELIWKIFK